VPCPCWNFGCYVAVTSQELDNWWIGHGLMDGCIVMCNYHLHIMLNLELAGSWII
jgi:hypothetical protein